MSGEASTDVKTKEKTTKTRAASNGYVVPVVGVRVPGQLVEVGFWGGLAGAAVLGVVDPPLAVLLGAGVVIARHNAKG